MIRTSSLSLPKSRVLHALLMLVIVASSSFALLAADGDLDLTFGKEGKVRTDFLGASTDWALGVALQADGKMVAVGTAIDNTAAQFAVARYNRDGSLDATFGDGGKVLTLFRGSDLATAVAVQRNGKIVVAGISQSIDPLHPTGFAVACYNRDGSLDLRFGDGGKVLTEFPNAFTQARAMAIQADGKIVVVGQAVGPQGLSADVAIARYTAAGALDPSFGGDGTVIVDIDAIDDARAVVVPFDGRIVIAGSTRPLTSSDDLAVLRLNRDGSLDPTFGAGGIVRTDATGRQDLASSVMIQRNGKIVVAGWAVGDKFPGGSDVVLARYERNGSLDATFGTAGIALADIGARFDQVSSAALQADGRIVVGGASALGFTVSRYDADGSPDRTFGTDGVAEADFSTPDEHTFDSLTSLVIQPDGKIVAAGYTYHFFTTGDSDFALARFDANCSTGPGPR